MHKTVQTRAVKVKMQIKKEFKLAWQVKMKNWSVNIRIMSYCQNNTQWSILELLRGTSCLRVKNEIKIG